MYINGVLQIGTSSDSKINKTILNRMCPDTTSGVSSFAGNPIATMAFSPGRFCNHYHNENLGVAIFLDGVVYNTDEIKKSLDTQCTDTTDISEILAYGFKKWGKDIISMCDGEFIMAFIDLNENSLTLARDRLGTAPIYYYHNDNYFIFSSSLKNILSTGLADKVVDTDALTQFFQLTYIPAPKSIIKNIHKMTPATILEVSSSGNISTTCYWDVDLKVTNTNYKECKSKLQSALTEAVQKRLNLNGAACSFLSGGFDSTIIVGLMSALSENPVRTLTIGFNDKSITDERPLAQLVAELNHTDHSTLLLDWNLAETAIDKILSDLEEPFADSSLISTYIVCKKSSERANYALTGDAGDELFAGYNKYLIGYYNERLKKTPAFVRNKIIRPCSRLLPYRLGIARKVEKTLSICDLDIYEQRKKLMSLGFKEDELKQLLKNPQIDNLDFIKKIYERFPNADEQTRAQYVDLKVTIDGCMLPKVKLAADMAGFKTIAPMLDKKVVELAFSMPSEFKIKKKERKIILKDTFRSLIPKKLYKARKHGFGVPIKSWLQSKLKDKLYEVSSTEFLKKQGLFNPEYIQTIIDNHISGKEDRFSELWAFLVFQSWYKKYISEE